VKSELSAPARLRDVAGPAGDCVRAALSAREPAVQPPAFSTLRERRLRRTQGQLALGALALAATALLGVRLLQPDDEMPSLRAEAFNPSSRPAAATLTEPAPVTDQIPPQPPSALRLPAKPGALHVRSKAAPAPVAVEPAPIRSAAPVRNPPDATPSGGTARACADLARGGAAEDALACYQRLASGSGMTAELALFEQARLEGKALRRPDRALKTLDAYRLRFPSGSLRPEVMLARIDWLVRSGERLQALEAVDEALASGLLRERSAELERLRGSLASP
jgi:hypothetical protein